MNRGQIIELEIEDMTVDGQGLGKTPEGLAVFVYGGLPGDMMAPVLLFAFTGIVVGLASVFTNTQVVGKIAEEGTMWYNFWYVVAEGGWTVFRQIPLLFARRQIGRASCRERV